MLVPSVPLWRIPKQHSEHWACTFSFLMLFFPAVSEKCKTWWVSAPRAQLIENDVHHLWIWHVGPPFLPLPPPASYSKQMERTYKKLFLLNCRYIIKHFVFCGIRNIIGVKTLKDSLHWESQYGHGQVKSSLKWEGGFLKTLSVTKSQQLMMRVYFSSLWAILKMHLLINFYLFIFLFAGIQNCLANKCLNAPKCPG